ncbi:acylphosphatase [Ekhidna lutea]|uniref:acylphosphatase n=1 Tax=Ekhidna lutea TaxID=447679 RepID=A0A239IKN2_EKHLU|nr:acylphosphatase [Ekhidna lutea]SNS94326.1 acylphosphatase [Ekhidna lutea]
MIAYRIKVTGRVQGVFFRASTKEKAEDLGIKGLVRNESDGSVLIEAEGEEVLMQEFIEWCQEGPLMARVDHIEKEKIPAQHFESFRVTY